jgi:REP element-mobilizing transposase RayT
MRRSDLPDGFYHVTGRATGGGLLYRADLDRVGFNGLVALASDRFSWRVHARCLMETHYHLIVETTRERLSAGMHLLNGTYTKRFNKRHGRRGCLFEGRYTATLIESEEHYNAALEYIRQNPVDARLRERAEDWPWTARRATGTPECP